MDAGRQPGLGQGASPRLGEIASPQLAAFRSDEHERVRADAGEGFQMRDQLGHDQVRQRDFSHAGLRLRLPFDEAIQFVDGLDHPNKAAFEVKGGSAALRRDGASRAALWPGGPARADAPTWAPASLGDLVGSSPLPDCPASPGTRQGRSASPSAMASGHP